MNVERPKDDECLVEKGIVTNGNPNIVSEKKDDSNSWKKYLTYLIGLGLITAILFFINKA